MTKLTFKIGNWKKYYLKYSHNPKLIFLELRSIRRFSGIKFVFGFMDFTHICVPHWCFYTKFHNGSDIIFTKI